MALMAESIDSADKSGGGLKSGGGAGVVSGADSVSLPGIGVSVSMYQ